MDDGDGDKVASERSLVEIRGLHAEFAFGEVVMSGEGWKVFDICDSSLDVRTTTSEGSLIHSLVRADSSPRTTSTCLAGLSVRARNAETLCVTVTAIDGVDAKSRAVGIESTSTAHGVVCT